jgi:hypothetical protein
MIAAEAYIWAGVAIQFGIAWILFCGGIAIAIAVHHLLRRPPPA